jgi:hypothetical protein
MWGAGGNANQLLSEHQGARRGPLVIKKFWLPVVADDTDGDEQLVVRI